MSKKIDKIENLKQKKLMFTTLEHLEQVQKKKDSSFRLPNILREFKIMVIIFWLCSIGMLLFTNADLFIGNIVETFNGEKEPIVQRNQDNMNQDNTISSVVNYSSNQQGEIENLIEKYKTDTLNTNHVATSSQSVLKNKIKEYSFEFNTLPPTNRLIIPNLELDVPLITSKYKEMADFTRWNYDKELEKWVVKYPTTPEPGNPGNTLLFGHTSQESREHNEYGTVFKNIPKLKIWDEIQIVRYGELKTYRIIEQNIVKPKWVNDVFMKFQSPKKDYLSIMWCYPIGKATERIIITAEEINKN